MSQSTSQPSRVFVNSLPKSGTHLLSKAIEIFGYKEYMSNRNYVKRVLNHFGFGTPKAFSYEEAKKASKNKHQKIEATNISIGVLSPYYVNQYEIRHWLSHIPHGQYFFGHVPWTPLLGPILTDLNYRHLVIIRDPRAVLASVIAAIVEPRFKRIGRQFLKADFRRMSPLQRLNFILEGKNSVPKKADIKVNSFADAYRSILAWRNDPNCLLVHFEDLVGEQGGGNVEKQRSIVENIASHLNIQFDDAIAAKLTEIYNPSARTFRMGKIDGWKQSMEPASIERLNEYCEPLCNEAGYKVG